MAIALNGFTQQNGMTVVLCTHNQRHMASAHHIIRKSNNGKVNQEIADAIVRRNDARLEHVCSPDRDTTIVVSSTNASNVRSNSSPEPERPSARQVGANTVYKYCLSSIRVLPFAIVLLSGVCFGFLENFPRAWLTYWTRDLDRGGGALHSHAYWVGI